MKINNGEIIEILTTSNPRGPSRDWLKIAKTSSARSKIKSWFKHEKRDENIVEGRAEVEREFRRNNITLPEKQMMEFLQRIAEKQRFSTVDDLFASIGYGGLSLNKIMPRIREEYNKLLKENEEIKPVDSVSVPPVKKVMKSPEGIIIEGIDNCLVKFSRCCDPLPGDEIIGFITRGHGVSIHTRQCSNVPKNISEADEPERWVRAEWAERISNETFQSTLQITATDRTGLLADITNQLSSMHLFIHALNSREAKNGMAVVEVTITVNGINHLKMVISRLSGINGIVSIGRA